mgnify:CR=1 FL=1
MELKVVIIGSGTMGAGIAQVSAQCDWHTILYDPYEESLNKGINSIENFWKKGISKGKNTQEQVDKWRKNIHPQKGELKDAVADVDLVIEAVPENLKLKQEIFQQLDQYCKPMTILATNTSGLSIRDIAEVTSRSGDIIGMHFFNPVPLMPLLEIVKTNHSSKHTIEFAQEVAKEMGKTSIVVEDSPGFATSRLGVMLGNEAIMMLAENVASAKDIDLAMTLGYKHPMGPLELTDLVGLDVRRDILNYLAESLENERYRPHPLLDALVKEGSLGKKVGKGIYDWSSGTPEIRELPKWQY